MILQQTQRGAILKMTKNLRLRAIGILVLSAILFVMPIGAIFANSSMTSPVMAAEDTDGGSTEDSGAASDNNAGDENGSDESGDVSGNEGDSASDNEAGEGDEGEIEEPVKTYMYLY